MSADRGGRRRPPSSGGRGRSSGGRGGGRRGGSAGRPRTETLRIDGIAKGGEGVGRLEDGRVCFVHRTAPGDLATVELTEARKRWTRGRLVRLDEPSPERREPPCPFYLRGCGGCTVQHLPYDAQLAAKARIVADALTRIGGLSVEAETSVLRSSSGEDASRRDGSPLPQNWGRGRGRGRLADATESEARRPADETPPVEAPDLSLPRARGRAGEGVVSDDATTGERRHPEDAGSRSDDDDPTTRGAPSADPDAPLALSIVPAPDEWRYRNRLSFTLRRLATGRVVAGFHRVGEPGRVLDVDGRCLLPEPAISRAWDALRAAWGRDARLLPAGEALRLTLRATAGGDVSLLVEGGSSPGDPDALLDAVPGLSSVWHRPGSAPPALLAGAPGLPETWGGETVELSGGAFLQVNRRAADALEAHVLALAGDVEGLRVVDAYCGIGLHARRLARRGARVVGIELDGHAVAAAREAAPDGASFEEGSVEELLPARLPADLVVLNPPRAGVAAEVTEALVAAPAERIVYVSCDPATLARDLARLAPAYRVDHVRCFDLFPQTAHVETVAALARTDTPDS